MIEAYAFLAMFLVQILAVSVLFPARLIRYARTQSTTIPAECLAQLYPGVDHDLATKRFLAQLRVGSTTVAVIGLLVLGSLLSYTQRSDWDLTPVIAILGVYSMLQFLPLALAAWVGFRFYQMHEQSLFEGKRKATLERRKLFDFISPAAVVLAVLAYCVFVAFVIYIERESSRGYTLIGVLTLLYALQAFDVHRALYGKKNSPLDTHALRVQRIGFTARFGVYICTLNAVFFAFAFTADLLDLRKWVPFGVSVLVLITSLLIATGMAELLSKSLTALSRRPEADELGSNPVC